MVIQTAKIENLTSTLIDTLRGNTTGKNDKNIKGIIFDFDGTLLIKRQISEGTINFIKNAKFRSNL